MGWPLPSPSCSQISHRSLWILLDHASVDEEIWIELNWIPANLWFKTDSGPLLANAGPASAWSVNDGNTAMLHISPFLSFSVSSDVKCWGVTGAADIFHRARAWFINMLVLDENSTNFLTGSILAKKNYCHLIALAELNTKLQFL